jgi:(5-formylfuran-3-yl)methyl phosphate synthase
MTTPRLLVSVRDAAEAEAALAGGADLIDVKEPARGPLGRADADVIAAVVKVVGGRVPVSAALGELRDYPRLIRKQDRLPGVSYVKWGLAGQLNEHWAWHLVFLALSVQRAETVVVAYADWLRADAPPIGDITHFKGGQPWTTLLVDTFIKDGSTLLDYLSVGETAALVRKCRTSGLKVALAGSLGPAEIERLHGVAPDWFAVRGAACAGGREGRVEETRVRELARLVRP